MNHFPLPLRGEFRDNGRRLCLLEPFIFADDARTITVPAGFVTDFHSVPRGLWNLMPPWEYPEAGVIHDYGYQHPDDLKRTEWDGIYRRVLHLSECPWWRRQLMHRGVRVCGWRPWNRYRTADLIAPKECDDRSADSQ